MSIGVKLLGGSYSTIIGSFLSSLGITGFGLVLRISRFKKISVIIIKGGKAERKASIIKILKILN